MSEGPKTTDPHLAVLREEMLRMPLDEIQAETVASHRIGYWSVVDPYDEELSPEMIALADEQLERYVQMRISDAVKTQTDAPSEDAAELEVSGNAPSVSRDERCGACGSTRFVRIRIGGPDGFPRAQCVPCGRIREPLAAWKKGQDQ